MLHPDLHRLQEQYNSVLDEHEAGHLSYEDALATVQAMTVIDGGGFVWMIDSASGAFLRATPGEAPFEADPSEFIPAQIPAPGSAPWASQQDLMRPPSTPSRRQGTQQDPYASPHSDPYADPHVDPYASAPGGQQYPPFEGRSDEMYSPMMNRRSQKTSSLASVQGKIRSLKLPPFVEQNKRIVGVLAVLAVLFLVIVVTGGNDAEQTIPPATQAQVTQPPVSVPETVAPAPESTAPVVTTPVDPNLPSNDQIIAALQLLVSGDRNLVRSAFVNPPDDRGLLFITARFKGYNATNIGIRVVNLRLEDGKVFAEMELHDKAVPDAPAFASKRIRWIRGDDGQWRINNPVDLES